VGVQRIDGDTAESTAGWCGCCTAQPRWRRRDRGLRVPVRLGGSLRWASIWQPTRHGTFCRMRSTSRGPVQVGGDPVVVLRSAEQLLTHVCMGVAPARLHNLQARLVALEWRRTWVVGT
jgi:hypothetical protein